MYGFLDVRLIFCIPVIALLSGCTMSVSKLQEAAVDGEDYASGLATEYRDFSSSEVELGHFMAANRFAEKGLAALEGKEVFPDTIDSSLDADTRQSLRESRSQLMKLISPAVKESAPLELARAQLLFDCWQHQMVVKLSDDKALCKDAYTDAVNAVIETVGELNLLDNEFRRELKFPAYRTSLTKMHRAAIHRIIRIVDYYEADEYWLQLRAYTGKRASQRRMTEARLYNVKKALLEAGIPARLIRVQKDGSAQAVILSRDNYAVDTKVVTITLHINDDDDGESNE